MRFNFIAALALLATSALAVPAPAGNQPFDAAGLLDAMYDFVYNREAVGNPQVQHPKYKTITVCVVLNRLIDHQYKYTDCGNRKEVPTETITTTVIYTITAAEPVTTTTTTVKTTTITAAVAPWLLHPTPHLQNKGHFRQDY
jgi:hypothetical protein